MRQITMVLLVASIGVFIMQCSENESLNSLNGRMETVIAPIDTAYTLYAPYAYLLHTDSIKWVYEFPSGGTSRVSLILSGHDTTYNAGSMVDIRQNHLDLAVETHTDSVPGIVHLAFDSVGGFLDTVPIAVSQSSEVILPTSSRLFVTMVNITPNPDTSLHTFDTLRYPFDTIQLADPHTISRGQ
jgi:hypothetical protein